MDNPVTQTSLPLERFDLRHSFYLQETIIWSSKLIPFRGRRWGTVPVNVRSVREKHNAVRQADSGLGADARADPVRLP